MEDLHYKGRLDDLPYKGGILTLQRYRAYLTKVEDLPYKDRILPCMVGYLTYSPGAEVYQVSRQKTYVIKAESLPFNKGRSLGYLIG